MGEVKILEHTATDEDAPVATAKWLACLIEAVLLLVAIIFILLLRLGVYEPAYIPTASMENMLSAGDRVVVDHRRSLRGNWQRGDIVLFETDENWGVQETLAKRIVGLPGEAVEIRSGQLYINDKLVMENYLKETPLPENESRRVLGSSEYFVLGDNRNNSEDSRDNGPIVEGQIRGRIVYRFYPLGKIGRISRPAYASP